MTISSASILGDSLETLAQFPEGYFDACIADPPYNMSKSKGLTWAFSNHVTMQESWDRFSPEDYLTFTRQWLEQVRRVVKPNGNLFVFGTYHNIYSLGFLIQRMDLKVLNSIVWVKPNAQPNITCRMLTESTEHVIWACNNSPKHASKWTFDYQEAKNYNQGKQLRNVWEIPLTPKREKIAGHPNQKPEALIRRIIRISTRPGDCILDPFGGSGTTGYCAALEGRRFVQVERNPEYWKTHEARFQRGGVAEGVAFIEGQGTSDWLQGQGLNAVEEPPRRVDAGRRG